MISTPPRSDPSPASGNASSPHLYTPSPVHAPGDYAIDLTDVTKVYRGGVHALRGIHMQVRRGEIFGLLGPNGAGKSTLVKILMTVIAATQARGSVLGRPVGNKETLARVGYLPEHHRFPEYLTGSQVLSFLGAMSGVDHRTRKKRGGELLDLVGMTAWKDKRIKGYSKGMRQRIGIAQALMNNPELVVLDEPTDGVDPVGRRDIRNMLSTLQERGLTVFINSHLLSELELVSNRVAILVKGKVVSQGTIEELTSHRQYYEIELDAASPPLPLFHQLCSPTTEAPMATDAVAAIGAKVATTSLMQARGTLATGETVELHGTTIRVLTANHLPMQPLLDALRARGGIIKTLRPVRPTLEDLFMEAVVDPTTGREYAPGAATGKGGAS